MRASSLLALAAVALTACGGSPEKTVALTQGDNGRTVVLKAGDTLWITLPENLTTPYAWKFTATPSTQLMALTSSKYVRTPAAPGVAGSGGHQVYTFKVEHAGATSIALALTYVGRPPKVVQRFAVQVRPG